MRQILFRAKRKNNGEWVEGYYALIGKRHAIICSQAENYYTDEVKESHGNEIIEIIPETVCQYTGLTDKNGNRIWENDIVRTKFFGKDNGLGQNFFEYDMFAVRWFLDGFRIENKSKMVCFYSEDSSLEVIGNVFDNADLLEEKA